MKVKEVDGSRWRDWRVKVSSFSRGAIFLGEYRPFTDEVRVRRGLSARAKEAVLAHEMQHRRDRHLVILASIPFYSSMALVVCGYALLLLSMNPMVVFAMAVALGLLQSAGSIVLERRAWKRTPISYGKLIEIIKAEGVELGR